MTEKKVKKLEEELEEEVIEEKPKKREITPKEKSVSKKATKPKKKYICHGIWHGQLSLESEEGHGWLIPVPEGLEHVQSGQIIELTLDWEV